MLTRLSEGMYDHQNGDSYTVNVSVSGGASIGPASLCGEKDLIFPATIGPADYANCSVNYQIGVIIRYTGSDGLANVTVSSAGQVVDTFPAAAPPNLPRDRQIVLSFGR